MMEKEKERKKRKNNLNDKVSDDIERIQTIHHNNPNIMTLFFC